MKDAQETTECSGQISRRDGGPGRSVSYLEELGEQIALLSAQQDASTFESLTWIREFDEDEGWFHAYSGFLTCANWLAWRTGLDIGAASKTPVRAPAHGRVTAIGFNSKLGYIVRVDHGYGIQTLYGHLAKYLVKNGQRIKRGDVVGLVGSTGLSTGPHLHYMVQVRGRAVNPRQYILE